MATIKKFSLTSGGAAYNLNVGFVPDTVTVWNYTKWATDGSKVKFYWHKGMTAAYALSEICDDTGVNRAIETSNGFTEYDSSSITDNSRTVSGITAANPGVVTVSSSIGASASADGAWFGIDQITDSTKPFADSVKFDDIGGMVELNALGPVRIKSWLSSTTFSLDLDTSSYTAFSAGTARNQALNVSTDIKDSGFKGITLGSTVIGANSDVLYIECVKSDEYKALGDIG